MLLDCDLRMDFFLSFFFNFKNSNLKHSIDIFGFVIILSGPDKVKNLSVTSVTVNEIDVAWDQPSSGGKPTTYILQKWEYEHSKWLLIDKINSNKTTYCVTNLKPGTLYTIQVKASNNAGESFACDVSQRTKILGMYL